MGKTNTYNSFRSYISFLFKEELFSDFLNKEQNITAKSVVSVWFIHFSTYFYHLVRFTKIYNLSLSLSLSLSLYIYIYKQGYSNELSSR